MGGWGLPGHLCTTTRCSLFKKKTLRSIGWTSQVHRPDAVAFISQEVYRAALFAVFFAQVLLAGAVPLVGAPLLPPSTRIGHLLYLLEPGRLCRWQCINAQRRKLTGARLHTHAGPLLNFVLLSWLYALYCFDYKWSLHGVALQQRIAYFERHWCFFLGGLGSHVVGCLVR